MKTLTQICEKLKEVKGTIEDFLITADGTFNPLWSTMCVYGKDAFHVVACPCSECVKGPDQEISSYPPIGMLTFSNEEQQRLKGLIQQEPRFAKKSNKWGFGTTEDVLVDYKNRETIKIYIDVLGNKINVKYGSFETHHRDESGIIWDPVYEKKE